MDFIIDTLFQVFFAFFWIIGLFAFLLTEKNKKKYKFLILLIPLLMIWSIYSYTNILKPRFRDIKYYINHEYRIVSGKCSMVNTGGRTTPSFVLNEDTYYYNPWVNKVYQEKNYRVKYLPSSKYVIKVESIE